MTTFSEYNPHSINFLKHYLQENDAYAMGEFFGMFDHVGILTELFNMPEFKNTTVQIVFRNPTVRYKSGLYITSMSYLSDDFLNTCDNDTLDREINHILLNMAHTYINSTFPQLDFGNVHTMPVLLQALLVHCCFPDRVKFLHISDLTNHMETHHAVEGVDWPQEGRPDTESAHSTDERRYRILTSVVPEQDIIDWLEPDNMVYDYVRHNHDNLDTDTAIHTLLATLDIPDSITRHRSIIQTARSAAKLLPHTVAEKIQLQFDNHGNIANQKLKLITNPRLQDTQ